jgi:hypothetical protein
MMVRESEVISMLTISSTAERGQTGRCRTAVLGREHEASARIKRLKRGGFQHSIFGGKEESWHKCTAGATYVKENPAISEILD